MNYPNGIKRTYTVSHANRGMNLENELNLTNEYYLNNSIAVIYKKPTPITIKKVDYINNIITQAKFKIPSTTDYNGIYRSKYIDFEAKETRKENFPLTNIHGHQIEHLKKISICGGIGFIIVRFSLLNVTYLLTIEKLELFISTGKKQIPLSFFKKEGHLVKQGFNPYLDYLKIIDKEFL